MSSGRWKHCVVTGGSRGIGLASARRLAAQAGRLTLVARDMDRLRRVADHLARDNTSAEIEILAADLGSDTGVSSVSGWLGDKDVDLLICAAGVYTTAPAPEADPTEWDRMLQVNLRAPMHLARVAAGGMCARGRGTIVLIGSVAGRNAFPGNSAYCASKYGLRGFAEALFYDVRDAGVRVCHIAPGMTATDMTADTPGACRERMIPPETVADAVAFAVGVPDGANVVNLDLWPQRDVFSD